MRGAWKGDGAGYSAIHKWITAHYGKPSVCAICWITKKELGKRMHWANLDGKYSRDMESWQPMCPKCHYEFDGTTVGVRDRWEKFTGQKAKKIAAKSKLKKHQGTPS